VDYICQSVRRTVVHSACGSRQWQSRDEEAPQQEWGEGGRASTFAPLEVNSDVRTPVGGCAVAPVAWPRDSLVEAAFRAQTRR
jgi:hypothetical protein